MNPATQDPKDNIYPEGGNPAAEARAEREKRERNRKILSVIFWLLVILLIAFLVLFISCKVGRFDSMDQMFRYIWMHLSYST